MADPLLPGQHGQFADKDGRVTGPFYRYLQWIQTRLAATETATATVAAAVAETSTVTLTGAPHTGVEVYGSPSSGYQIVLNGDGYNSPIVSQIFGS